MSLTLGLGLGLRPQGGAGGAAAIDYVSRWGVQAYWKLDASGADTVGANTLTAVGVPTYAAGKVGNAAQLVAASTQYYTIADNASLSLGANTEFFVAGWVNFASLGAARAVWGKGSTNGAVSIEYCLLYETGVNKLRFYIGNGTLSASVQAATLGAPALATWYFVLMWYDSVAQRIRIRVNGGTVDETAWTSGTVDGTRSFDIGRDSIFAAKMDGMIDAVVFGKSPPGGIAGVIAEIQTVLYAGGAGREFPWN